MDKLEEILTIRGKLQIEGKTVVFTNGHFDLLHVGHVDYLQKARELGDVLIVGLNSDASTRALKGEKRPIVPQGERARLLAALACVDYVIIFEETTANSLVEALEPDFYVKGGDWDEDHAPPEAEVVASYGGQVCILPYLSGHSTTELIKIIVERSAKMKMSERFKELTVHQCPNGMLYEFFWSEIGQMAVRTVWPGETAGGHKHPITNEWWLVVQGEAIIYLEYPDGIRETYPVSGKRPKLISVPAGTGHDIKNVGDVDVIFIFFADQLYDPETHDKVAWSWE